MPAVVTHRTKDGFQRQYGTLWNAAEAYFEGEMQLDQAAAFEGVIEPAFLAAVAQTRLYAELVKWIKQA
jgi:hypothetical protein